MKSLLVRAGFRELFLGQAISALGDWMVTVALMALALKLSGSSAAVGAILVLRLLPAALGGPLAARAGRSWDRRRTMLAMDAARAAVVVVIPLVQKLAWLYVCAFLLELLGIVFLPARDASVPDLVGPEDLALANGLILGSSYATIPLGAGAFAAVVALTPGRVGFLAHHPFALVFWVDALTFAASFALISRLHVLGPDAHVEPEAGAAAATEDRSGVDRNGAARHGFRAAFGIPLVRSVMPATVTIALGLGTLFSLGIVYVRQVLRASDTEFGVLIALFGVGAAAGLGLLRALAHVDPLQQVRWGVTVQGGTIALMSAAHNLALGLLGAAVFGAATAFTLSAGMSVLQSELSGEDRVLAFTAFHVVIRSGLALAAIGSGLAADLVRAVRLPLVGRLPPVRLVLVSAGLAVLASASLVRRPSEPTSASVLT
ncbi:MAG: MFS transporter [Acidimicrobiales bacterium]